MKELYTHITTTIHSIFTTLSLDIFILRLPFWNNKKKIEFLYKKYIHIIKYLLHKKFLLGESRINVDNKYIYYNAPFGLAPYQFVLKTHYQHVKKIMLNKKPVIVDIGANVGYFSLLCKACFPEAIIYACEPIQETFSALKKNLEQESTTTAINYALSDKDGTAKMSFRPLHNELSTLNNDGDTEVKLKTLDTMTQELGINHIDLLKIDTESHELKVLQGAQNILAKTKYLLIEITIETNHYTVSSLISQLYSPKYNFQLIQIRTVPNNSSITYMDCLFINTHFSS